MADQKLQISQTQSLVMTPQLQQAIKLLQYNNMELAEFLDAEMEKNPLLEKGEGQVEGQVEGESNTDNTDVSLEDLASSETPETPGDNDSMNALDSGDSSSEALDVQDADYYSSDDSVMDWGAGKHNNDFGEMPDFDQTHTREKTLREHLEEQVNLDIEAPANRLIAAYIIDGIDGAGYFQTPLKDIAEQLGCKEAEVETVLEKVQQFDPAGIAGRNLRECLALQLKDRNRYDPAMEKLLENLEMLADGKVTELCKLCGVDAIDLQDMIGEIRALNPKPAEEFVHEEAETLIPDVFIRAGEHGDWQVELNSQTLPKVLVNNKYFATVSDRPAKKEDKKYLNDCLQSANWLVRALDQRAQTIMKVATALVAKQDGFFRYGIEYLKPLTLKDIAEVIEMHESTVSRVTTNKYVATPRGTFELKYFFTSAIGSSNAGGADHSAEFVRHKIKALIDGEPAKKPLSDDKIVTLLTDEGIEIARRTVAKYREQLGIGSSTQRRRKQKTS